jgi:hypothetical protein
VSNTIASNNNSAGIVIQPIKSVAVTGVLSKVTANNNLGRNPGGTVGSGIFVNSLAGNAAPLKLFSYGDNDIDGNTNNKTAAMTQLAMH